uniref:Large ribosomal subunit protein eL24 n=1 Tax=Canis lupus familiaris TaxID=9615 RepID=A0A8C0MJH5_CANLF
MRQAEAVERRGPARSRGRRTHTPHTPHTPRSRSVRPPPRRCQALAAPPRLKHTPRRPAIRARRMGEGPGAVRFFIFGKRAAILLQGKSGQGRNISQTITHDTRGRAVQFQWGTRFTPDMAGANARTDGKVFQFLNAKCESAFLSKRNPRQINWTVLYRRKHKKGQSAHGNVELKFRSIRLPK